MAKPKSPSEPTPKSISEDDVLEAWFPLFDAHVLVAMAAEIEDDADYFERAHVLIRTLRERVDLALNQIERVLNTGTRPARRRARSA